MSIWDPLCHVVYVPPVTSSVSQASDVMCLPVRWRRLWHPSSYWHGVMYLPSLWHLVFMLGCHVIWPTFSHGYLPHDVLYIPVFLCPVISQRYSLIRNVKYLSRLSRHVSRLASDITHPNGLWGNKFTVPTSTMTSHIYRGEWRHVFLPCHVWLAGAGQSAQQEDQSRGSREAARGRQQIVQSSLKYQKVKVFVFQIRIPYRIGSGVNQVSGSVSGIRIRIQEGKNYQVADPDSIRSVDPDPNSESGSRRAKMTHKSRTKLRNFMFWRAGCSLLRAEGFFCNLAPFVEA
jgi:hypothetical protein